MSLLPSDSVMETLAAMEALMDRVEATLDSAEPEALATMAQHQAALLAKLKGLPCTDENAAPLARTLARSRQLALRIEAEMATIRSLLTASANKKRINGAYAPTC